MINQVINGDCTAVIKTLEDNSVDLIIADPPYGGNIVENKWDETDDVFSVELLDELYRVLKPEGSIYIWCSIGPKSKSLMNFVMRLSQTKFHLLDMIVWNKVRGRGNRRGWLFTREEILWAVKDSKKYTWNEEYQYSDVKSSWTKGMNGHALKSEFKRLTNVWSDVKENFFAGEKGVDATKHPTAKPIKAMERIILAHTKEGDIVLDPFLGSGTTALAAKKLNRNYIGIEISKEYCDLANSRLKEIE
jgi:DNA modification methylase